MKIPLKISYRGIEHSPALDALMAREARALEDFSSRIISCRVTVEYEFRRGGSPYHVRIELGVPGQDIVVTSGPHKDPVLAVRDAFRRARRRLQDHLRIQQGAVKHHVPRPIGSKESFSEEKGDDGPQASTVHVRS